VARSLPESRCGDGLTSQGKLIVGLSNKDTVPVSANYFNLFVDVDYRQELFRISPGWF
jgi:hypothetical protein